MKNLEKPTEQIISKEQFRGKSKIEKGLSEFRVYRSAVNQKLLDLKPIKLNNDDMNETSKILNRGMFFTTQKEMALEYRQGTGNPMLLEIKGVDFLEDLENVEDQNIEVIIFSHEDLATYDRILKGRIKNPDEIRNFFKKHTFKPSEISPRMLRRSAEIIVLFPKGLNKLPLKKKHVKKQKVKPLNLRKENKTGSGYLKPKGEFHRKIREVEARKDKKLAKLHRTKKRLQKQKSDLIYDIMVLPRWSSQESVKRKEIRDIERQIIELDKQIEKRQKIHFLKF